MKEIHIIPLNDDEWHDTIVSCTCAPTIEYPSDDIILIVHYAWDGREAIEDLVEELAVELNYGGWGIFVVEEE